jgi:hypothetical protein|tara:strand:- start:1009 stop:1188 length:180 start_codon:yes stop_codon:yes gene_type:complete
MEGSFFRKNKNRSRLVKIPGGQKNIRFDILPHPVIIVVTKATPMESPTLSENSSLEHMF